MDPNQDSAARLLEAGYEAIDQLSLAKAIAGATTQAIAERAGVTTGSFFHHFANASEFADALVLSLLDPPEYVEETIDELVDAVGHVDLLEVMRQSLTDTWQIFNANDSITSRFRVQMHFWAHHNQQLGTPTADYATVADVLRESYNVRQDEAASAWQHLLDHTGRQLLPPFTLDRLATALTSLFQGLAIRHAVDPDRVDDDLFADVVVALAASVTVPIGSRLRLSDLTEELLDESGMSPQARSGARRRRETRARVTTAASDLFGKGWESVSMSEVADAAKVSPQTVINLFGTVRAVAAAVFGRHVADIRAAADDVDDPLEGLQLTLTRLAEAVILDPGPARALLAERLEVTGRRGAEVDPEDIRVVVPLAEPLLRRLEQLELDGSATIDVSRRLINFVMAEALARTHDAADIADLAMRLLPASALP